MLAGNDNRDNILFSVLIKLLKTPTPQRREERHRVGRRKQLAVCLNYNIKVRRNDLSAERKEEMRGKN